ncbi:hypothetical protein KCP73_05455 [Salmonella enterica subsp. enterica]|nr:hypothetical protein KCP73_05455 [Salmonella enterica subsp. enterica]
MTRVTVFRANNGARWSWIGELAPVNLKRDLVTGAVWLRFSRSVLNSVGNVSDARSDASRLMKYVARDGTLTNSPCLQNQPR